jgi:hypothetical protein
METFGGILSKTAGNKSEPLFDLTFILRELLPEVPNCAGVGMYKIQHRFECCRLPGTVSSDESGYFTFFQREADMIQRESRIGFG